MATTIIVGFVKGCVTEKCNVFAPFILSNESFNKSVNNTI